MTTDVHLADLPEHRAALDPGGRCLDGLGERLTNARFAERVRVASQVLAHAGVGSEDVVAAMMPNHPDFVTLMFATWRLGAVLSPLNPALTAREARYQLTDSRASIVVAEATCRDRVAGACDVELSPGQLRDAYGAKEPAGQPAGGGRAQDIALLIYTSGTTARPKGVILTHANLRGMARIWVEWLDASDRDRCLLVLPLFHVNAILVSVVAPMLAGASIVIGPKFDAESFWDLVRGERPTYFSAVPTILATLLALPGHEPPPSLRFVANGGAPSSAELLLAFERRFSTAVIEGYGLSECTLACTINPLDERRKLGTVGVPLPGLEVAVVDAVGERVPAGTDGEVIIKGPTVMRGYLGRPAETAAALRDGWLHTGDVGRFDEDGYLTLVDRIKDLVIWGGENISPREVEHVLAEHDAVLHASVVGRTHERYGEEPVAFVALKPGRAADEAELLAHCADRLARFKVPRKIWILPELPVNAVGKLVKEPLRQRVRSPRVT
jgi:acyl-CoA synthetase (AMP-forming)/AMP-acid ligase II